jgi:hypothetical protein
VIKLNPVAFFFQHTLLNKIQACPYFSVTSAACEDKMYNSLKFNLCVFWCVTQCSLVDGYQC